MKKKILFSIILFLILSVLTPNVVKAEKEKYDKDKLMAEERQCYYKNSKNKDYIVLYISSLTNDLWTPEEWYVTSYNADGTPTDTTQDTDNNKVLNKDYAKGTGFILANGLDTTSWFRGLQSRVNKDWKLLEDNKKICPSNVFQIHLKKSENKNDVITKYMFCDTSVTGYYFHPNDKKFTLKDSCYFADRRIKENGYPVLSDSTTLEYLFEQWQKYEETYFYTKYDIDFTTSLGIDKDYDVDEDGAKEEAKTDIEKYCTEGPTYDEVKCIQAQKAAGVYKDDTERIDKDLIVPPEIEWPKIEPPVITECESLLGDPKDGQSPAYYLSVAFKVLRYVAIIILIVMSTMDFVGAVSAQDNDAIQKAVRKVIIRAISCVIIFLLPTLVEFILQFINENTTVCISLE